MTTCLWRLLIAATFAAASLKAQPSIVQGPVVDAITYSSARITWITDQPADSTVRYGRDRLDAETVEPQLKTWHSWYVSGLAAGTEYKYQACSKTKAGAVQCADERTFVTAPAEGEVPRLPEPPRATVDTSMPSGPFGDPFLVDDSCSNLPQILQQLASLEGPLNYEVLIPPQTSCMGQWVFPKRQAHEGWVVVRTAGSLPPEGKRIEAGDSAGMAKLITNGLPGIAVSPISFSSSCSPGSLAWGTNVPGMALFVCSRQEDSGGPKSIAATSVDGGIVLTVPAHGYQSGNVVKVKGTGAVDTGWRITVIDADRFSLDGARTTKALRAGGTVERNDAWTQVAFRSGPEAPADCAANDWFLRTDVAAQDGLYWCTSQNTWTRVRPGNFVMASSIAAVQFGDGAARYRFTGLEITHIPVPDPPPADWSKRDHKQGNFGALVASDGSNDRLIFDRCDIHGLDYPARLGRGLYLNGSNVALIHSRVHKVNRWGEADAFNLEATAIDIAEGPGPGKIEDNYLEAIGITLFFPDYSRHHLPPADFVISKNYFAHPEKYLLGSPENRSGKNYPNRQILELKAGQRMVVEGNIFDGNWADVTQGAMVLLTPRVTTAVPAKKIGSINQGILQVIDKAATDPYTVGLLVSVQGTDSALDGIWEVEEVLSPTRFRLKNLPDGSASQGSVVAASSHMQISDIDIRNNLFRNGPNLLWINGHDAGQTSKTTQRIRFHNNLVLGMDIRAAAEGGKASPSGANQAGRSGVAVFAAQGMEDLIVSNNTIQNFKGKAPSFLLFDSTKLGAHAGLSVVNNIFTADRATAASISGTLPGAAALDRQWTAHPDPKWSFHGNVICCGMKERSPSGNMWTDDAEDLGIVNSVALGLQRRSDGQYANAGVNLEQLESAIGTRVELIARKDLGRQPETTKRRIAGR